MPGHHGCHAGPRRSVLTLVEGGMEASSARHGAASARQTSRTRYGHDEETERVAGSATGSHPPTRFTSVTASAKRHGYQVVDLYTNYYKALATFVDNSVIIMLNAYFYSTMMLTESVWEHC